MYVPSPLLDQSPSGIRREFESVSQSAHRLWHLHRSVEVRTIAGTSHAVTAEDFGCWLETTNNAAVSISVPAIDMPDDQQGPTFTVRQRGDGQVTIDAAAGATVQCAGTASTRAKFAAVTVQLVADDLWAVCGDYT